MRQAVRRSNARGDWPADRSVSDRYAGWLVAALVGGGITIRLLWLFGRAQAIGAPVTESQRVGVALATIDRFANPFSEPTGATAHLSPLMPNLIGLVYRCFGVATTPADIALLALSVGLVSTSFLLCFLLFRQLGAPPLACFGALAVATLFPLQFALEVREMQVWEAPLMVVAITAMLLWAVRIDARGALGWPTVAGLGIACGLLFLASPVVALSALAVVGMLVLRHVPWRQWALIGGIVVVIGAAIASPWALRNHQVFGKTIWTRSNGGLELSLAYNDTTYGMADHHAAYLARLAEIHPAAGPRGLAALRAAGGEIAYYKALGVEASAWIDAHPRQAARLLLRHAGQYLVPPDWFFSTWGANLSSGLELRRLVMAGSTIVALLALPFLVYVDRRYLYISAALLPLILPYIVVQPILRYRYLISSLVLFIACDALVRVAMLVRANWQSRAGVRMAVDLPQDGT